MPSLATVAPFDGYIGPADDVALARMSAHVVGLVDSYLIINANGLSDEHILTYWKALALRDRLKYRFSDIPNCTAKQALGCSRTENMYHVVDTDTGGIIADFALENFTGRAAQVHFSMHPDNDSKFSLWLADAVSNQILNEWRNHLDNSLPYLDCLFGNTPLPNRVACIFIMKVGFQKMGILPSGCSYLGDVVDSLITYKTMRH